VDQYGDIVTGWFVATIIAPPAIPAPGLPVAIPPRFDATGLNDTTLNLCETVPAGWANLVTGDIKLIRNGVPIVPDPTVIANCINFQIPTGTNTFEIDVNNHPSGQIKIIKNTVNGNGVFAFTTTQPANNIPATFGGFSLDTGLLFTKDTGFITVKPGSYSVTENLAALPLGNWALTGLTCSAGGLRVGTSSTANITIIPGAIVTCTYTNTLTVPSEACSPGYWKQPQHFGSYPWQTSFGSHQVVPITFTTGGVTYNKTTYGSVFSAAPPELFSLTFPEVISLGGGGIYALGRQSAAAYLDAVVLGGAYGFTPAQVVQKTNDAFNGITSLQSAQSAFEALLNNENCPLGRSTLPGQDLGNGIGHK
jgi:hypothetical protein